MKKAILLEWSQYPGKSYKATFTKYSELFKSLQNIIIGSNPTSTIQIHVLDVDPNDFLENEFADEIDKGFE